MSSYSSLSGCACKVHVPPDVLEERKQHFSGGFMMPSDLRNGTAVLQLVSVPEIHPRLERAREAIALPTAEH